MASLRTAQHWARERSQDQPYQTWYVVYEPEEDDGPDDGYYIASAFALETHYQGIHPENIVRAYIAGQES